MCSVQLRTNSTASSDTSNPLARLVLRPRPEIDSAILHFDQAMIRDWAAGHITRQVLHDISWIAARLGRRLNVNHPVAGCHLAENLVDLYWIFTCSSQL
jgi:hypothetical protein